jgi:hypothetical protein
VNEQTDFQFKSSRAYLNQVHVAPGSKLECFLPGDNLVPFVRDQPDEGCSDGVVDTRTVIVVLLGFLVHLRNSIEIMGLTIGSSEGDGTQQIHTKGSRERRAGGAGSTKAGAYLRWSGEVPARRVERAAAVVGERVCRRGGAAGGTWRRRHAANERSGGIRRGAGGGEPSSPSSRFGWFPRVTSPAAGAGGGGGWL